MFLRLPFKCSSERLWARTYGTETISRAGPKFSRRRPKGSPVNRKRKSEKRRASAEDDSAAEEVAISPPIDIPSGIRVILAEKPSVAKHIAKVLNISGTGDRFIGRLRPSENVVTWASGHLVDWTDPEGNAKKWRPANLPIVPEHFKLIPSTPDSSKVLVQMQPLLNGASEIVCATDAGREGELIFRLIYQYCKSTAPVKRLWVSSQTDEAMQEGFRTLRPSADFDGLYKSAWCRKAADWMVGINATQAYTFNYRGKYGFSSEKPIFLGRVQTPVLRMIVDRHLERINFKSEKFWLLFVDFSHENTPFRLRWFDPKASESGWHIKSAEEADQIAQELEREGTVRSWSQRIKLERPPRLFDLTDLQKDCNRRFGWSAEFTLGVLQKLYEEHKLVTYPRTNSKYLPRDMLGHAELLLRQCIPEHLREHIVRERISLSNRAVFDDSKVSDHFAIIPTAESPASATLTAQERKLYDHIVARFADCRKKLTEIVVQCGPHLFHGSSTGMLEPGWRMAHGVASGDAEEPLSGTALPAVQDGQRVSAALPPTIEEEETKPPPHHTEASLLHLMETAGRALEDEDQREAMKDIGLGTPATRASTIEKVISSGCVVRENRFLVPTQHGISLIELLKDEPIASPQLTGQWELRLNRIQSGEVTPHQFLEDVREFTRQLVIRSKEKIPMLPTGGAQSTCPACRMQTIEETPWNWKCSNCRFRFNRSLLGVALSKDHLEQVVQNGETELIQKFTSKSGRYFAAKLVLEGENMRFAFANQAPKTGPAPAADDPSSGAYGARSQKSRFRKWPKKKSERSKPLKLTAASSLAVP